MSALPPRREPPDDADEQYRRASEHDPSRPSEATRRAVLSHAARLAAERARRQAHRPWLSFLGVTSGWRPALIGTVTAAVLAGVVIAPQFLAPRAPDESQLVPAPGAAAPAPAQAVASVAAQRAPEARTAPAASSESARPAPPPAMLERPRLSATANRPAVRESGPAEAAPAAPATAVVPASSASDAMTTLQLEERAGANAARVMAPAAAKARSRAALSPPSPAGAAPDALRQAAQDGNVAALATLLGGGSDVDARDAEGRTALMQAILHGQARAVAILLDHGADPNAADAHGTTPLEAAVAGDQREIIAALRRYGAR